MQEFIKNTQIRVDVNIIKKEFQEFLEKHPFPIKPFKVNKKKYYATNQLGLTYRKGAESEIGDAIGSLYDAVTNSFTAKESDFTEFHDDLGTYTKESIILLSKKLNVNFGRIRYLRLMPKTGLSVHFDTEKRFHLVIETNQYAFIGENNESEEGVTAKCYHLPSDGFFYEVDTTKKHFVYNGGSVPRIHLVLNIA